MCRADLQLPREKDSELNEFLILHLDLQACLLSAQKQLSVNTWIAAGHSMVCCSANHHKSSMLVLMLHICLSLQNTMNKCEIYQRRQAILYCLQGARVASSLAHAQPDLVVGAIFFSYPLHPPGKQVM